MNLGFKKATKINLFILVVIFLMTFITFSNVVGLVDLDAVKTIKRGYGNAFTYTIENFKNQRFTLGVVYDATIVGDLDLYMACMRRGSWDSILDNASLTLADIEANNYLYNGTVKGVDRQGSYSVVIPDWEEWTFIFLNLNNVDMTMVVKIEHRHILWWLWIVIPTLVILGLTTYYILENTLKYQRARINTVKAINKLGSRNEGEQKRSLYWLQSNGTKAEINMLSILLDDKNPSLRSNAAKAIGAISKRLEDKTSTELLISHYKVETNPNVKEAIVNALCDIADERSIAILEEYLLKDRNEILRFKIAESFEEMGSPKTISPLVKIIQGNNTDLLKIASRRALDRISKLEGTNIESLIENHS